MRGSMRSPALSRMGSVPSPPPLGLLEPLPLPATPAEGESLTREGAADSMRCHRSIGIPAPLARLKRCFDVLDESRLADSPQAAKRPMLSTQPPPGAIQVHARTLFRQAHISPRGSTPVEAPYVPVLPADAKCFQEATTFARKHVTSQAAHARSLFSPPLRAREGGGATNGAAQTVEGDAHTPATAPVAPLQLDGVTLLGLPSSRAVPSFVVPLPVPPALPTRPRFKLQCPPTPVPRMCIVPEESGAELFGNRLLMRRGASRAEVEAARNDPSPLYDDEEDARSVRSAAHTQEEAPDIHALPSFVSSTSYASRDPFQHTRGARSCPFIFERDFRAHKCVGSGAFFEVFRVEAAERDGETGATTAGVSTTAASSSTRPRVYAVKKSLRPFHSDYDRACLLRETRILALLHDSLMYPPTAHPSLDALAVCAAPSSPSSSCSASLVAPKPLPQPHRNPHLIRWFQTWQEGGYFFEQLQYATCNLAEFIYVLMETPPTPVPTPTEVSSSSLSTAATVPTDLPPPPSSYFHQHLPRLFLSLLTQTALALYSLHNRAGSGARGGPIVHLDIKPDNFLLNRRGTRILLSDFGLARLMGELTPGQPSSLSSGSGGGSTWTGGSSGGRASPMVGAGGSLEELEGDSCYMAPELLQSASAGCDGGSEESCNRPGQDMAWPSSFSAPPPTPAPVTGSSVVVSPACDLFSLGLLLFEMVSNAELPKSGPLWQRLRHGGVREFLPHFPLSAPGCSSSSPAVGTNVAPSADPPAPSQTHLPAYELCTSEEQQDGVTAWMVDVIANLLSPVPRERMTAAGLLVTVQNKLVSLGWMDSDGNSSSRVEESDAKAVQDRAAWLAFEWTATLPPCLALPPLSSLNFAALLERAREMNLPPATPTPLTVSPCPQLTLGATPSWAAASASSAGAIGDASSLSRGTSPYPMLMRQRSSPSPSRSGGFFGASRQREIRASPVPGVSHAVWPSTPSPGLPSGLTATPGRMQVHLPVQSRTASAGLSLMIPTGPSRAPSPSYTLTVPLNCTTPSLLRNRTVVRSSTTVRAPLKGVDSRTADGADAVRAEELPLSPPKPRWAAPSGATTGATAASLASSTSSTQQVHHPRPLLLVDSAPSRSHLKPLSPLKLNSPVRLPGSDGVDACPTTARSGASSHVPLPVRSRAMHESILADTITTRPESEGARRRGSASGAPLHASIATAVSLPSPPFNALSGGTVLAAHSRALFTASLSPPSPPVIRSSILFSCLASASVPSPPASPPMVPSGSGAATATATAAATTHAMSVMARSMFGASAPQRRVGASMFGFGARDTDVAAAGSRGPAQEQEHQGGPQGPLFSLLLGTPAPPTPQPQSA